MRQVSFLSVQRSLGFISIPWMTMSISLSWEPGWKMDGSVIVALIVVGGKMRWECRGSGCGRMDRWMYNECVRITGLFESVRLGEGGRIVSVVEEGSEDGVVDEGCASATRL